MSQSQYSSHFRLTRRTHKYKTPSRTTQNHLSSTPSLTCKTNKIDKYKGLKPKHKAYKLNKIDTYHLQYKALSNPLNIKKKKMNLRIKQPKIRPTQ